MCEKKKEKYKDEKYILGTIESQYDNYLSSEEEIEEVEKGGK